MELVFNATIARLMYKGYKPLEKVKNKYKIQLDTNFNKFKTRMSEYTKIPKQEIIAKEVNGVLFCYFKKEGKTYIGIRGSKSLSNWLDVNFKLKKDKVENGGRVHRGFLKVARNIKDIILDQIDISEELVITGHSLGGALSLVLGNLLYEQGYNVSEIYAFESPNIANGRYIRKTKDYDIDRYLIKNNMDIVTLLPPSFMRFKNYNDTTIYFNRKDKPIINPNNFYLTLDKTLTMLRPSNWTQSYEDHAMEFVLALCQINEYKILRLL